MSFVFAVPKGVCVYNMTEYKVSTQPKLQIAIHQVHQERGGKYRNRQAEKFELQVLY